MRQYHVRQNVHGWWVSETWSKGISGKLWYVQVHGYMAHTIEDAKAYVADHIRRYAGGYTVIDDGDPYAETFDNTTPAGGADECWWAVVLGVDCQDVTLEGAKAAFREKARATHPDIVGGDGEEFRKVYAAWEYVQNLKGW
jgi:hypothetical protein